METEPLILPPGYKCSDEFALRDVTFTGPGHVLRWAKENSLFPKKGCCAQWNWFFDAILGEDVGPKDRTEVLRKEFINGKLQFLEYPITLNHKAGEVTSELELLLDYVIPTDYIPTDYKASPFLVDIPHIIA